MQLSCLVQVQGHLGGCNPAVSRSCSHHKGRLDGAVLPSLLTWLLEVPSPSSCRPFHRVRNKLTVDFCQSRQLERGRERKGECPPKKPQSFYNLTLEVTSHYFCHIPFVKSQEIQCTFQQRELHKGVSTRRWGHGGPP